MNVPGYLTVAVTWVSVGVLTDGYATWVRVLLIAFSGIVMAAGWRAGDPLPDLVGQVATSDHARLRRGMERRR